jgi:hypothetical protein
MRKQRRIDVLKVRGNSLGPVLPCTLEIHPLTVFVGRQGTGKSLVAQVLYALEELPFLAQYVQAQQRKHLEPEELFARVVDQLRSVERRFGGFSGGTTTIDWKRGEEWEVSGRDQFSFSMYRATNRTRASADSQDIVSALASRGIRSKRHAVFVPTERMVVSQLRSALSERVLSLPITYELFADWLELAAAVHDNVTDDRAKLITKLTEEALDGRPKRIGSQWKWSFPLVEEPGTRGTLDLDMASSGQRANWSLGYLGAALFALREQREFASTLTLYIEEPELHLHPEAQVKMSQVIAVLVNAGFRIVVTTHSLPIIYSLNNLSLAHKRFGREKGKGLPDPRMRIDAADLAVYDFSDRKPRDLVDRKEHFIDEHELGDVGARLGAEMNLLLNRERAR